MDQSNKITLNSLPVSARVLATCYILSLLIGYFVALVQVYDRSHFDMDHVVKYYRGDELGEAESLMLPQSFSSILSVTHTHSYSQPILFGLLALIYLFSRAGEKTKSSLFIILFTGILLSNTASWLIRYVSPAFVHVFPVSQTMIFIPMMIMILTCFKEMWCKNKKPA